jgi:hypothetical protein
VLTLLLHPKYLLLLRLVLLVFWLVQVLLRRYLHTVYLLRLWCQWNSELLLVLVLVRLVLLLPEPARPVRERQDLLHLLLLFVYLRHNRILQHPMPLRHRLQLLRRL